MIIGTAGHIDHGKTALVRALSGVDTDRLPEEKRRGITIDLGFAPLELPGVGTVGLVDVPGHEAFVRTMVAGATGIDVALLVIAADEGVMPQTREHISILELLGIRAAVVAITKCDLVDADWLDLVRADLATSLAGTVLETAPVIATSARTGQGIEELRETLGVLAAAVPPGRTDDVFRMPVDRVFTVRGTGTVVTGTVWSGSVAPGMDLVVQPGGRATKVRSVQSHGRAVSSSGASTRTALALSGVEATAVARGSWLTSDADWRVTKLLRAEVTLLPDAEHTVGPREWLRFHLGTADAAARFVAPGGPLRPGERRPARVVLQEPVLARAGDRFVVRLASPPLTIGGGVVVDPLPPRRRVRPWPLEPDPAHQLERLVREAGPLGLAKADLVPRAAFTPAHARGPAGPWMEISGRLYDDQVLVEVEGRILLLINDFHERLPLSDGFPLAEAASAAGVPSDLLERVLAGLVSRGAVERRGAHLVRPGWKPRLSGAQQSLRDNLLEEIRQAGMEPPDVAALTARHHSDPVPVLRILEREGFLIAVESQRYFSVEAVGALVQLLRSGMERGREYTPSELREVVGLSRKYLIPFLEYCDRTRITERRATGRVLVASE